LFMTPPCAGRAEHIACPMISFRCRQNLERHRSGVTRSDVSCHVSRTAFRRRNARDQRDARARVVLRAGAEEPMNRMLAIAASFVTVTTLSACMTEPDPGEVDVTTQDLSSMKARVWFYADESYTTQIGKVFMNCNGGNIHEGSQNGYARGYYEVCPSGQRYGCYEFVGGNGGCPAEYDSCVICD
jgi:hypothetical protein